MREKRSSSSGTLALLARSASRPSSSVALLGPTIHSRYTRVFTTSMGIGPPDRHRTTSSPISHVYTSNFKEQDRWYLCNSTAHILSSTLTAITTHLHSFRISFASVGFVFFVFALDWTIGLVWIFPLVCYFFLTSIRRWRDSLLQPVCSLRYLSILAFVSFPLRGMCR